MRRWVRWGPLTGMLRLPEAFCGNGQRRHALPLSSEPALSVSRGTTFLTAGRSAMAVVIPQCECDPGFAAWMQPEAESVTLT